MDDTEEMTLLSEDELEDFEKVVDGKKKATGIEEFNESDIDEDDDDSASEFAGSDVSENDDEEDMDILVDKKNKSGIIDTIVEYESDNSQSEEEDEDEDDDENHLQKLDEHYHKKVIENFHPELKTINYEEVDTLATVVRDKDNYIIDPMHKTIPILSRYERARILGERAKQINSGAKPFIDVEPSMMDGYLIALKELENKRIPFIIQRPLPNGASEYWRVADLEML